MWLRSWFRACAWLVILCFTALAWLAASTTQAAFSQPDKAQHPQLFLWSDTCNVWVLRDGEAALLIDLGDGSVLDHLSEIGVKRVEWVLFTHHHREQCQGSHRLDRTQTKVAAPLGERALFETPTAYRKMQVRLQDAYTIHGASYVRPPVVPIAIDRAFEKMDTFAWRGNEFWCVDTRGNSPGSMSYLLRSPGNRWSAFSGDLMLADAKLHTWYDSEWDYGFAAGIWALANSAGQIAGYDPQWLFPSHGPAVLEPAQQLAEFQEKLRRFERLLVRGYPVLTFSGSHQDRLSRPTKVPHVWQVSPHIYKFRGPDYYPNFYLILADSGRALAIDCGLIKPEVLDRAIVGMREHLGLKSIDAIIPTHMHGDHFLQAPHLRQQWGAQIWALERMADVCAHPEWFDYAAPVQAYGKGIDGVTLDRRLKDGEKLNWEGFEFTVDWMPGQTEFALCVQGVVDGKRVAFTGDNLFGDPSDPSQTGHEAVVAHNSAVLEEGYIQGSEYLARLKPDLILGGHSYVMPEPAAFVERYRQWSYAMRDAFRDLIREEDYRYGYDPFWVRAQPYRSTVSPGGEVELTIHLRNFMAREQTQEIRVLTPPGLTVEPRTFSTKLPAEARVIRKIKVRADHAIKPGVQIIAFDITRDGRRDGALFDAIVEVLPKSP
ncbi:MAG: MBL fold metallo-hydrolase [Planctomycetaceae bacterium]|nr:MBL fold metallo-hydrolase [Planctomycetaceae bacterium]